MTRSVVLAVCFVFAIVTSSYGQQMIGGCQILPADHIWNTPIDALPALPNSSTMVNTIGASRGFHADFGSGSWNGGPIGIPLIAVSSSQQKFPASFFYAGESDPGPYPIPMNAPIEGGSNGTGDRHVLALDTDNCVLHELFRAFPGWSSWTADAGAIFNLTSHALRPTTWTSADAAGLPILPGLVTYEEVQSGEIKHAIRFTAPQTRREFVWPARHFASSLTGSQYPRMGERLRLKASFDISGYPAEVQVILRAMKKYGIMLADNGGAWFISGTPDPRWNDDNLRTLGQVLGSNFEAVDATLLRIDANSGAARQSAAALTESAAALTEGTVSADGTQVPSVSQIVDAQGTVWTIGYGGAILRNGASAAGGLGSQILWSGGTIYVLGTGSIWYRWTGSAWTTAATASPSGPSADGTHVPSVSQIVDAQGAVWTIGSGEAILRNGASAAGGLGSQMLWSGGTIYVLGTGSIWYRWTGSSWATAATASPSGPSADGTQVPSVSQIVDAQGAVWTIGSGWAILRNGASAAGGLGSQILWSGGTIYVLGTGSIWYRWTGSSWATAATASPSGPSADGTQVPSVSQIVDAQGAVWTIGSGEAILRNGASAAGGLGSQILWSGGTIYVLGTGSIWYRWNGSSWATAATASPSGTSADGTHVPSVSQIVDAQGAVWTIGNGGAILRNGASAAGGLGSQILWSGGTIYVLGTGSIWYRWTGIGWVPNSLASAEPTFSYRVLNQYPHDAAAFTQGLALYNNKLYESTGLYGASSLRHVRFQTGVVLRRVDVPADYFAEGITVAFGKIFQLTWQHEVGFIYDLATMAKTGEFRYSGEGWGLTHDSAHLIMSNGTSQIRFLDPVSFQTVRTIDVIDSQSRPVQSLNELEYVNGQIYANIWQTNTIVRIDPASGRVTGWIDLHGLLPAGTSADVLNGIAYDESSGRLWVTGKLWPWLFEIVLEPAT